MRRGFIFIVLVIPVFIIVEFCVIGLKPTVPCVLGEFAAIYDPLRYVGCSVETFER